MQSVVVKCAALVIVSSIILIMIIVSAHYTCVLHDSKQHSQQDLEDPSTEETEAADSAAIIATTAISTTLHQNRSSTTQMTPTIPITTTTATTTTTANTPHNITTTATTTTAISETSSVSSPPSNYSSTGPMSITTNNSLNNTNNSNSNRTYVKLARNEILLYNRCSLDYVTVLSLLGGGNSNGGSKNSSNVRRRIGVVKAKRPMSAIDVSISKLKMETELHDNIITLRLKSIHTNEYICFGPNGNLITKVRVTPKSSCLFREEKTDHSYFRYRSVQNPNWYMGFNNDGQPIAGNHHFPKDDTEESIKQERCYHFSKHTKIPV